MNPWKLIGYAVAGLLIIAGVFAWNRHKDSQYDTAVEQWKQKLHASDSSLAVVVAQRETVTVQNTQSIPVYLAGKTKIIHDVQGTSAEGAVKACFDLADVRISKCEAARKADSLVIGAQQDKIKVLEARPEPQLPRFQMYGAVGYSLTIVDKDTRTAPAFRLGIDTKLIGPVRLSTDGQLTMPSKGKSNPMLQANLMARVNF
jgi:hypothetical protein